MFIGPSAEVVEILRNKIAMLGRAQAAGFDVPLHSSVSFSASDRDVALAEAQKLGFPLIVKSCSGGRGRATRVVRGLEMLGNCVMRPPKHRSSLATTVCSWSG